MKNKKNIELPNTNLLLLGSGLDVNGNKIIKLSFYNGRAFSIQTNGVLPKTNYLLTGQKTIKDISKAVNQAELNTISKEVSEYIKEHGSKDQKDKIKVYKETETLNNGGKIESLKSELEKAKKQLESAEKNNAPEKVKTFAKSKIEKLEKEIGEYKAEPKDEKNPKIKIGKKVAEKKEAKVKIDHTQKSEAKTEYKDGDFEIKEEDGATLVASNFNRNWVMTIEPKGDKFKVSCCSDEKQHPLQDSKAKAISYCKDFLHCKNLFEDAKDKAKKRKSSSAKDKAKKLITDITATTEKAKESVSNKVETLIEKGKTVTTSEQKEVSVDIKSIVKSITTAIQNQKERKKFVENLIKQLQKIL